MTDIAVNLGSRSYTIHIGDGLLGSLAQVLAPLAPTRILVVTNTTVGPLYARPVLEAARAVAPASAVELPDGEQYKDWTSVQRILDALAALGADRRSVVVALGGGVVGDMAGFAAAIWMRGIRFVQVPTTLLAMVDSSVGGKTGINQPAGKNLIGAFHQPSAVVADTRTLETLDARQVSAGLAEIIKHGMLADAGYFDEVARSVAAVRAMDHAAVASLVAGSCRIKAGVVSRDETERGERARLNLGHTFGHAIEKLAGYGTWLHGEAVGCGLILAADMSRRLGGLTGNDCERIRSVVAAAGLPLRIDGIRAAEAIEAMRGDKKSEGRRIRFIVMDRLGHSLLREVPDPVLMQTLEAAGWT